MTARKQSALLAPGDQFMIDMKVAFKAEQVSRDGDDVLLIVVPAACSDTCPDGCGCDTAVFGGGGGQY